MASEKESFVFYRSFFEALQDLKDKETEAKQQEIIGAKIGKHCCSENALF